MILLLVALVVGSLSLIACSWLASTIIARPDPSADPKGQPHEGADHDRVAVADPSTTGWSTLDDLQLTRLLRDPTIR